MNTDKYELSEDTVKYIETQVAMAVSVLLAAITAEISRSLQAGIAFRQVYPTTIPPQIPLEDGPKKFEYKPFKVTCSDNPAADASW